MILNVHPKEILHQPLATAWSVLEGARLANVDPYSYVSSRHDTDEINRLQRANCSIWASKELLMYVKLQEQIFSGVKKIALLADGSSFNGENWQAGIIWSWEKDLGAIALCQVWGESYLIHTFSVGNRNRNSNSNKVIEPGRITEANSPAPLDASVRARVMLSVKQERATAIKEWAALSEMVRHLWEQGRVGERERGQRWILMTHYYLLLPTDLHTTTTYY